MKRIFLLILIINISIEAFCDWQTVIDPNSTWEYFLGNSEPDTNWYKPDFNAENWLQSTGGFGYGDNDDHTTISHVNSLYIRTDFTIANKEIIKSIILSADYDDGFIAYLNGIEIARSYNLKNSGDKIAFNYSNFEDHEASIYRGEKPEQYSLDIKLLKLLINGENTLSIQVQNVSKTSSDMSSNFFLTVDIDTTKQIYKNPPSWFEAPMNLTESHLPIVILNTYGLNIPDEPKIKADMKIIKNGDGLINRISDTIYDFSGRIGIEMRGQSSQYYYPKKQYGIEIHNTQGEDTSVCLLGLPKEEDWILNAPYGDKSLIRNAITYNIANKLGQWAPNCKFCEVVLNGEYMGVYILMEKIKRDKNRVSISKTTENHNSEDKLTGGYIIKVDKWNNNYEWWMSNNSFGNHNSVRYQYHYPKPLNITYNQKQYIQSFIEKFETSMLASNYKYGNDSYKNIINIESFVDFAIINEVGLNVDGYRLSSYMHKDADSKGGKLKMGPVWDFNLAYGNDNYYNHGKTNGWQIEFFNENDSYSNPWWWFRIWDDSEFRSKFMSRYKELRQNTLSDNNIDKMIDSLVNNIKTPSARNFQRWDILGKQVWPNHYVGDTYNQEISYLKSWIKQRLTWIDSNISVPTGIMVNSEKLNVKYFPNPVIDELNISFSLDRKETIEMKFYSLNGQQISSYKYNNLTIGENEITYNISELNLNTGHYLCVLKSDSFIKSFIITKKL